MIASLPRPAWLRVSTVAYAVLFFSFLFLPLVVVAVFAFNDAPYPRTALARFHAGLVFWPAWRAHRPVGRRPAASQPLDQRGGGLLGHAADLTGGNQ